MFINKLEDHLEVYKDRSELYQETEKEIYYEGLQNPETRKRYAYINKVLENGYLDKKIYDLKSSDFTDLNEENQILLRNMVNGITSEVGRALVGLAFLQLTIKSIAPKQCIRLHKGTTRRGSFSWVNGISMRSLDSHYNTPFLRKYGLLNINKYGIMMTRSLAENYPYSKMYKAEMRGSFNDWIAIVDALESETLPPESGLCYLMSLLKNRSDLFNELADSACQIAQRYKHTGLSQIQALLTEFFNTTEYSARAFEVVMHGLFQAMDECYLLGEAEVVPISQMRSANKKHGNVGDIELTEGKTIIEAWDAKYGKPYLRDELEELNDKLRNNPEVRIVGFVADCEVDRRKDILRRIEDIELATSCEIYLFSFSEWVDFKLKDLSEKTKNELGYKWLKAVVESFAQKRTNIAPIDEPCDAWLKDLIKLLK